jgi:hypothetical protein
VHEPVEHLNHFSLRDGYKQAFPRRRRRTAAGSWAAHTPQAVGPLLRGQPVATLSTTNARSAVSHGGEKKPKRQKSEKLVKVVLMDQ